jgi:hypothetical protein
MASVGAGLRLPESTGTVLYAVWKNWWKKLWVQNFVLPSLFKSNLQMTRWTSSWWPGRDREPDHRSCVQSFNQSFNVAAAELELHENPHPEPHQNV